MTQILGRQYADFPAIIRDVTAAEFAIHSTEAPAHSGIMYRVDDVTLYRWNGSAWISVDSTAVLAATSGTVDGVVIGGSDPAAITGDTIAATALVVNSALGLVTAGTSVTATAADMSANTGRVNGFSANLKNTGATVTTLKGADFRVSDAGGTANSLVGGQFVAAKSAGASTGEIWGSNNVVDLSGGSVPNAYGVVGDLTIGAGGEISGTDPNNIAAAGFFTSFVDTSATIDTAIDAAVVGNISGEETRGRSAKGTYGVVAMLNGSAGVESAEGATAAFKVLTFNTTTGGTFDYGFDSYYVDGAKSNRFGKADVRLTNQVCVMTGAGAPVDYTDGSPAATGEGYAQIGSLYVDITAGKLYINGGTLAQPVWKIVTSA